MRINRTLLKQLLNYKDKMMSAYVIRALLFDDCDTLNRYPFLKKQFDKFCAMCTDEYGVALTERTKQALSVISLYGQCRIIYKLIMILYELNQPLEREFCISNWAQLCLYNMLKSEEWYDNK